VEAHGIFKMQCVDAGAFMGVDDDDFNVLIVSILKSMSDGLHGAFIFKKNRHDEANTREFF